MLDVDVNVNISYSSVGNLYVYLIAPDGTTVPLAINNGGSDSPSAITALSTESLRMSFLSDNSHTSLTSVGEALDTMARKQ